MAVWYLESDDEITDAVARLRSATDERVVFVVPAGARIATGRINFKLLAREAHSRDLALAIASPDEQVRATAESAGVLTAATPDAAEAAILRGDEPPPASGDDAPTTSDESDAEPEPEAAVSAPGEPSARRRWTLVAVIVLLAVAAVGGVAALQVLPTAELTLTPRLSAIGPISLAVTATTTAQQPDAASATVPAVALPIPLEVEGTFAARGRETIAERASGEVTFTSDQQTFDQQIAAGTRVSTPSGIEFQTTEAVLLPRMSAGATRSSVTAPIRAVDPGAQGNVAAEMITVVPSLSPQGISVVNERATSGGSLEARPIVTRDDYDAAAVDLSNRLAGALAARMRDPGFVPAGATLFEETALLGAIEFSPDAAEVVGQADEGFSLAASAQATALAVDTSLVEQLLRGALASSVGAGMELQPGSTTLTISDGVVDGDQIRFEGTIAAEAFPLVDAAALRSEVAGLPVSEAQAILSDVGMATVNVWPDFLGNLPDDTGRITLVILEPTSTE